MLGRRGDFMIGMILSVMLFLQALQIYFDLYRLSSETTETNFALEELALVGKGVRDYVHDHHRELFAWAPLQREATNENAVAVPDDDFLRTALENYFPNTRHFPALRNIWGDRYKVVFIRSKDPTSESTDDDRLFTYVVATNGTRKQHSAGTVLGDSWLQTGMRRAVMSAGPSFAYVTSTNTLQNTLVSTNLGLTDAGAVPGDLAYIVTDGFSRRDIGGKNFSRIQTGDNEQNTMDADLNMGGRNILNAKYVTPEVMDVANLRLDSTMYDTAAEAENSCENNWLFITDKDNTKRYVTASGEVYESWTSSYAPSGEVIGHYGMNGENAAIDNEGRLYYISPTSAMVPSASTKSDATRQASTHFFGTRPRLAVCRKVNGQRTLAYIGENRSEDKIAFIVTAVDGDFIPPFFCPGQDANVVGGGSIQAYSGGNRLLNDGSYGSSSPAQNNIFNAGSNTENGAAGIMPRLFVIPKMVSTGPTSYPLNGIRAYAETQANRQGWIIHINVLADNQQEYDSPGRSFWVGNTPGAKISTTTSAGYMTARNFEISRRGAATYATDNDYVSYLRATVIGVCSGKAYTF